MLPLPVLALLAALLSTSCSSSDTPAEVTGELPPEGEEGWTDPGSINGSEEGTVTINVTEGKGETKTTTTLSPEEQIQQEIMQVGDRVFFDYNKSSFLPEGEETLRRQSEFLRDNPDMTITIEGHCDERGTREYNIALGERRAEAAKAYLVSLGISADRIATLSYGKERPSVIGHSNQAWSQNRIAVTKIDQ